VSISQSLIDLAMIDLAVIDLAPTNQASISQTLNAQALIDPGLDGQTSLGQAGKLAVIRH